LKPPFPLISPWSLLPLFFFCVNGKKCWHTMERFTFPCEGVLIMKPPFYPQLCFPLVLFFLLVSVGRFLTTLFTGTQKIHPTSNASPLPPPWIFFPCEVPGFERVPPLAFLLTFYFKIAPPPEPSVFSHFKNGTSGPCIPLNFFPTSPFFLCNAIAFNPVQCVSVPPFVFILEKLQFFSPLPDLHQCKHPFHLHGYLSFRTST